LVAGTYIVSGWIAVQGGSVNNCWHGHQDAPSIRGTAPPINRLPLTLLRIDRHLAALRPSLVSRLLISEMRLFRATLARLLVHARSGIAVN
jgi:hypothetical protein